MLHLHFNKIHMSHHFNLNYGEMEKADKLLLTVKPSTNY